MTIVFWLFVTIKLLLLLLLLDFFLMGTRLKIKKMAASLWGGIMTLNCDISRTSWQMEVSDGSLF